MRACILTLAIFFWVIPARAGSLLGADLTYTQIQGLTWSFTVTTYDDPTDPQDLPWIAVSIDGAGPDTIPPGSQTSFNGYCQEQIDRHFYTWQTTFPGPGAHSVRAWKPGRVEAVNLPSFPDNELCLSTTIIVTPGLVNSSPIFGMPQRSGYYADGAFAHDPMVTDPDGDSLSFAPNVPQGTDCQPLAGCTPPSFSTPSGDFVVLEPATGIFRWVHPNTSGIFTVAMTCTEWRNGAAIGSVMRDMTICMQAPFTTVEEPGPDDTFIGLRSLDGLIVIDRRHGGPAVIDILDADGKMTGHVRSTGQRTIIGTEGMAPGIYVVKVTDGSGLVTAGRFVVVD